MSQTTVSVSVNGGKIAVQSPYLPAFVADAKRMGGKWQSPEWIFDARDESRVRDLCIEHYGTDGSLAGGVLVTLRIKLSKGVYEDRDALRLGGRVLAQAYGRDGGAKLGEGVVLLAGGFTSGGSVKNWTTTTTSQGAELLLRDVPQLMAERLIASPESWVDSITLEPEAPVVDREALAAERARLVARVAEIDALLA